MAINFKRHPLNTFQAFPIAMYKRLQKYRLVSYLVSLRKIAKSLNYLYLGRFSKGRFSKGRLNFLRGERDMCLLGRGGAPLVHPGRDDHRNQQRWAPLWDDAFVHLCGRASVHLGSWCNGLGSGIIVGLYMVIIGYLFTIIYVMILQLNIYIYIVGTNISLNQEWA